jgi:hypothetical protein
MSRQSDSNGIGTKPLPKLKSGKGRKVNVGSSMSVNAATVPHLEFEIRQTLEDLGLTGVGRIWRYRISGGLFSLGCALPLVSSVFSFSRPAALAAPK